jgi:TonB family protein
MGSAAEVEQASLLPRSGQEGKTMKATFALLLALVSVGASATGNPEKQTITFAGQERVYYTFASGKVAATPEKPAAPVPLLLLLHGSERDGMSQIQQWQALAEQEGLVLVAPDSLNSHADLGLLHKIVEAVREKYPIDGKRIYLFGHSAGAVFALEMGVMQSQYFAATGVHAGAMNESLYPSLDDLAKRKLRLAIWVGTEAPYLSRTMVRNTQNALKEHGGDAQIFEMQGDNHDYYEVAKDLNPKIWSFLSASSLDTDAKWQTYGPLKLRVSSGVADSLKIHDVQPEYPQAARISHITGDVILRAIIDREGQIAELTLVSGHPLLAESAIKAVKQWRYRPYILNGNPVLVETTIKVHYFM